MHEHCPWSNGIRTWYPDAARAPVFPITEGGWVGIKKIATLFGFEGFGLWVRFGSVWREEGMSGLVARTGRHQQRYDGGCRLVAGCIPYRYKDSDGRSSDGDSEKVVEVLMINSPSGPGLLFPKGGWENDETVEEAAVREAIEEAGVRGDIMECVGDYRFKSKTHQDECCPEGLCRAAMFSLFVKEELDSWPEQSTRTRSWLTIDQAVENCRHKWMEEALQNFSTMLVNKE